MEGLSSIHWSALPSRYVSVNDSRSECSTTCSSYLALTCEERDLAGVLDKDVCGLCHIVTGRTEDMLAAPDMPVQSRIA